MHLMPCIKEYDDTKRKNQVNLGVLYAFRVPVNTSMTFAIAGYKTTN